MVGIQRAMAERDTMQTEYPATFELLVQLGGQQGTRLSDGLFPALSCLG